MNREKPGFTVTELLITIAIISMLVGILIPTLSVVRQTAKEVKQKAQLTAMEMALLAFKNDYGDYPPSDPFSHNIPPPLPRDYCGAQKLAEALLGQDLLGFHPGSSWSAIDPCYINPSQANLNKRKGPYLELATTNAFRVGISAPGMRDGLFTNAGILSPDRYVLCDVFGTKKVTVITPITLEPRTFYAGTPILYYKANTSSKRIEPPMATAIYNNADNEELIKLGHLTARNPNGTPKPHPLLNLSNFIPYIMDPKASTEPRPWPYRPDSYILISAGADGFYGTDDDIRNFGD